MPHLNFEQIKKLYENNKQINWHTDYKREPWKDKQGPLTIIDVREINYQIDKDTTRCGFVRYKCSDPYCRQCTDNSLVLQGHHKIIRLDGLDTFGKVTFKETKKRTIMSIEDQPVFDILEEGNEAAS